MTFNDVVVIILLIAAGTLIANLIQMLITETIISIRHEQTKKELDNLLRKIAKQEKLFDDDKNSVDNNPFE